MKILWLTPLIFLALTEIAGPLTLRQSSLKDDVAESDVIASITIQKSEKMFAKDEECGTRYTGYVNSILKNADSKTNDSQIVFGRYSGLFVGKT